MGERLWSRALKLGDSPQIDAAPLRQFLIAELRHHREPSRHPADPDIGGVKRGLPTPISPGVCLLFHDVVGGFPRGRSGPVSEWPAKRELATLLYTAPFGEPIAVQHFGGR